MRSYRSARSAVGIPMTNVAFVLIVWITCGIAAAGSWNAAMYASFHNCGRQGTEDQAHFLIKGLVGGPLALVLALLDSNFARSGWSLSTHQCAQRVGHDDAFGTPQEMLDRSY